MTNETEKSIIRGLEEALEYTKGNIELETHTVTVTKRDADLAKILDRLYSVSSELDTLSEKLGVFAESVGEIYQLVGALDAN